MRLSKSLALTAVLALVLFLFALILPPTAAADNTCTWNGSVDNDWFTAANWNDCAGAIPGVEDTAVISSGQPVINSSTAVDSLTTGTGTSLTIADGATLTVVDSFTQRGAIHGDGDLTIEGDWLWLRGDQNDNGLTTVAATAVLTISYETTTRLNRTILNQGSIVWNAGTIASLTVGGGLIVNNGSFTVTHDGTYSFAQFENEGSFVKSDHSGEVHFDRGRFTNQGTVEVETGALNIGGSASLPDPVDSGNYTVAGGAFLTFSGGINRTLTTTAGISAPAVHFTGGPVDIYGSYDVVTTSTSQAGARVNWFGDDPRTLPIVDLGGGGIGGDAPLLISQQFEWRVGAINGTTPMTITAGATLSLTIAASQPLNRVVVNEGTAVWSSGNVSGVAGLGHFINNNNFAVTHSGTFGNPLFDNWGSFVKTNDSGEVLFSQGRFTNHGTVAVETGTLDIRGSSAYAPVDSGSYTVADGALLAFGSSNVHRVLTTTASISAPEVHFAGGPVDIYGSYDVVTTTVAGVGRPNWYGAEPRLLPVLDHIGTNGGSIGGDAPLLITEQFNWRSGPINGTAPLTVTAGASLSMTLASGSTLNRTLVNEGTAVWSSGNLGGTGTFINHGDLTASHSGNALAQSFSFINNGRFSKTSGSGQLSFESNPSLQNNGEIHVNNGTLRFFNGLNNYANNTLTGGVYVISGTLQIAGADLIHNQADLSLHTANAAVQDTAGNDALLNLAENGPNGRFAVRYGADITLPHDFINNGDLIAGPAGALATTGDALFQGAAPFTTTIEIGGSPATGLYGHVDAGPAATLGGVFQLKFVDGFGLSAGDSYEVIAYGSHTGQFSAVAGLFIGPVQVAELVVGEMNVVVNGLADAPDLAVTGIAVPATATPGEPITVVYTVTNITDTGAPGGWTDSLYLSLNNRNQPEPGDILLGRIEREGGLDGGQSYSNTLTAVLPAVNEANYRVIVVTDSKKEVADRDRANNSVASLDVVRAELPLLALGSVVNGELAHHEARYYRVNVPAGGDVLVSLALPGAYMGELYGRFGQVPTLSSYDQNDGVNPEQSVLFSQAGPHYILVRGEFNAGSGQPFNLSAELLPLSVTGLTPAYGSNAGQATSAIEGSGFAPNTAVALRDGNNNLRPAVTIDRQNRRHLNATFVLTGLDTGFYDLVVNVGAEEVVVAGGYEVTDDPPGELSMSLNAPGFYMTIWAAHGGKIPVDMTYTNIGGADAPLPIVDLTAAGGLVTLRHERNFSHTVQFVGQGSLGQTMLPPGQSYTTRLWAEPEQLASGLVYFIPDWRADPDETIEWAALKDDLQPFGMPDDAWELLFDHFVAALGQQQGAYGATLVQLAARHDQANYRPQLVSQLYGFIMRQADNGFPNWRLGEEVDARVAMPGGELRFERVYMQAISRRFLEGSLGYGWRHNWETAILEHGSGMLLLRDPDGARLFYPQVEGIYRRSRASQEQIEKLAGGYRYRDAGDIVYRFNEAGQLIYREDSNGNRVTLSYSNGRLTAISHDSGDSFSLSYNAQGYLAQLTDHAGRVTSYTYDTGGHLTAVSGPPGTTTYAYAAGAIPAQQHALTGITIPDGTTLTYSYDSLGRLTGWALNDGAQAVTVEYLPDDSVRLTDAEGNQYRERFMPEGHVSYGEDGLGRPLEWLFDETGRPVTAVTAGGYGYQVEYGPNNSVAALVDPMGRRQAFVFDADSQQLRRYEDALGVVTGYEYDARGNMSAMTFPDGNLQQYGYDAQGNLEVTVKRSGQIISTSSNSRGQMVSRSYDGVVENFTYTVAGNLETATGPTGTTSYSYDSADRLTGVSQPDGRSLTYLYNSGGQLAQMVDQAGFTVNYSYDSAGRLESVRDAADDLLVGYSYDDAGRLARIDRGNGTYTIYTYDAANQVTNLAHHAPGGAVSQNFAYVYDERGRRLSMTSHDGVTVYGYNDAGELTAVTLPDGRSIQYEYDAAGSRISATNDGQQTSYFANELQQYVQVGDVIRNYDTDGNLVQIGGSEPITYTYDGLDRLVSVTTASDTWHYEYNPLDQRTAVIHNGSRTDYLVDPTGMGNLFAEYDGDGSLVARYLHTEWGLAGRIDGAGTAAFYEFDFPGSTTAVTGPDGAPLNQYQYLPFGELLSASETIANPFTYIGSYGVMAEAHGLHYMRRRYYQPEVGAFISADPRHTPPVEMYGYAFNNPFQFIDPVGLRSMSAMGKGIGKGAELLGGGISGGAGNSDPGSMGKDIACGAMGIALPGPAGAVMGAACGSSEDTFGGVDGLNRQGKCGTASKAAAAQLAALGFPGCGPGGDTSVITSFDPNDILGPSGYGDDNHIVPDRIFGYTIRFENDPDETTAPAFVVVITQVLDLDLDYDTFELGEFGFGPWRWDIPAGRSYYQTRLDLRPERNILVDVTASLDLETGLARWEFFTLDPDTLDLPMSDPEAGFLPPNATAPEGEGFVSYRIRPRQGLATGTRIDAEASIVFDVNEPILTPPIYHTIDAAPPASAIEPLPPIITTSTFTVSWSGEDDAGGAGIGSYYIYMAEDDGPFTPVLTGTTETSMTVEGEYVRSYSFYSVAYDYVGWRQLPPYPPQTVTLEEGPEPTYRIFLPLIGK
jgi:RHS repeat-associated protein